MSAWRTTPTSSCAGSDSSDGPHWSCVPPRVPRVPPVCPAGCGRSSAPPGGTRGRPAPQLPQPRSESSEPPGGGSGGAVATATGRHGRRARAAAARRGRGAGGGPAGHRAAGHRRAGVRGHGDGLSGGVEYERRALNLWCPLWGCGRTGGDLVLGPSEGSRWG